MRKIEENMLHALRNEQGMSQGNTVVRRATMASEVGGELFQVLNVYLHGNHIATLFEREVYVTLAGWDTPTTRSRLNAIVWAFARYHVSRVKGQTGLWPTRLAPKAEPRPILMGADTWHTLPRWGVSGGCDEETSA